MIIDAATKSAGIYQIKNLVNGRVYVGSAVNLANRKKEHLSKLRRGLHHSPKLQNAFLKYGEMSFAFEVVEIVKDKDSLTFYEQGYIDISDCVKSGYNICPRAGSTLGRKLSAETKQRMKIAHSNVSEETRSRQSNALKGKPKSEEWKRKMSELMKGRKASPESRAKMSEAAKNRTDEARSNIANAIRASDAARGGKRHSDEARMKISQSLLIHHSIRGN